MKLKCPACGVHFRAYKDRGHLIVEIKKDGFIQSEHSELCACKKQAKKEA